MSSVSFTLLPYRLQLTRALHVGGHVLTHREGAVIVLRDERGHVGLGDLAPLPGFHPATLTESREWLDAHADAVLDYLLDQTDDLDVAKPAPLSAAFGISAAVAALQARKEGTTPSALLVEGPLERVPVSGIFDGTAAEARTALESGSLEAFTTVKVKLGRRDPVEEREVVRLMLEELPDGTSLRLDGEGRMTISTVKFVTGSVEPERFDYIEEPIREMTRLGELYASTKLAVALSESLIREDADLLVIEPCVSTTVHRPSTSGTPLRVLDDVEHAARLGKRVVISGAYESGLGLAFHAQVAAAVMEEGVAAELNTDGWLADDVLEPAFDSSSGWIDTSAWNPVLRSELPS